MYKDDVVYYTDHDRLRTFIGCVTKSEKISPSSLIDLLSSTNKPVEHKPPLKSSAPLDSSSLDKNASETQQNSMKIHVNWISLASGEDYPEDLSPIPSVLWSDQLTLLERDHMLSDLVCHAQRGVIGSVVSCRLRAFVELLSYGRVMCDVDCSRLRSVSPWSSRTSENRVVWRGWLGRVIAQRSLAIVRFEDGARMLVREQSLRDFDPIPPTSNAFPDPLFEGAWLRGELLNLKLDLDVIDAPTSGSIPSRQYQHFVPPTAYLFQDTGNKSSLPRGHPSLLYRELFRSAVTRTLIQKPDGLSRIIERLPLFLNETKQRNAVWLSRLSNSATVSVFVECLIPYEARVHWLACRDPIVKRPPPSVIHGDDLLSLKPVHPYPHLFATTRDIWYIQLNESDLLYNLKAYNCPEELLYDWFTQNESHLNAVSMRVSSIDDVSASPHSQGAVASDPRTLALDPNASEPSSTQKTTAVWAQHALLNSTRRRYRVLAHAKQHLTSSEINRRAADFATRFHIYLTDDSEHEADDKHVTSNGGGANSSGRIGKRFVLKARSNVSTVAAAVSDEGSTVASNSEESNCRSSEQSVHNLSRPVNRHLHLRESHLPPLSNGSWVAVGIYATQTVCDVRWLDGTLEEGISSKDLQPLYFNNDEHELIPGSLVSVKTVFEKSLPLTDPASEIPLVNPDCPFSHEAPDKRSQPVVQASRDYGVVLSVNPNERTCVVQWFRTEVRPGIEYPDIFPVSEPEEIGVYELMKPSSHQITYGSLIWIHPSSGDPDDHLVAFVEDIMPKAGKLLVQWVDRTQSEIMRSQCLASLDTLHDADHWFSDDDSDEFESDQLTSDFDSQWETVTDTSSDDETTQAALTHVPIPAESQLGTTGKDDTDSEFEPIESYEEAVKKAADIVRQARAHTEAVRSQFEDHRIFAFWILQLHPPVPMGMDTVLSQVGTLHGAVASAISSCSHSASIVSLLLVNTSLDAQSPFLSDSCFGELLSPAPPLDLIEEGEMQVATDKFRSIRELLHQAYQLVHDYRIKKLFHLCDHRNFFSTERIQSLLQSIELTDSLTSTLCHRVTGLSRSTDAVESSTSSDFPVVESQLVETLSTVDPALPLSDHHTLNAHLTGSIKDLKLKAFVVNEPLQALKGSEEYLRSRIRQSLCAINPDGFENAYLIVSVTQFTQLIHYLVATRKRLLEQLTDFGDTATAWLGEVAPDMLSEMIPVSNAESPELTQIGEVSRNQRSPAEQLSQSEPSAIPVEIEQNAEQGSVTNSHKDCQPSLMVDAIPTEYRGEFIVEDVAPTSHHYYRKSSEPLSKSFNKAWRRDTNLLSTSLPRGVIVKSFSDFINLFSLLIVGPAGTPYEHGLFLFDIFLPSTYPTNPPQVHYHSFSTERINPNLYVDGNVCLSLIGTWAGNGTENWDPMKSSLLQLVVSLQGLVLNSEPYFNEAGFEACRGTAESIERSRMYNESVVATLVQSNISLLQRPLPVFKREILTHFQRVARIYASSLEFWASLDNPQCVNLENAAAESGSSQRQLPDFPLAPVTKGFQISVRRNRLTFLDLISSMNTPGCME